LLHRSGTLFFNHIFISKLASSLRSAGLAFVFSRLSSTDKAHLIHGVTATLWMAFLECRRQMIRLPFAMVLGFFLPMHVFLTWLATLRDLQNLQSGSHKSDTASSPSEECKTRHFGEKSHNAH
jgi:hypothetical protein